jgi:N-formylmaleamate deformylase
MEGWSSGFVETNAIRVHYARSGGNLPPVVLAHGLTEDGQCWPRVAAALALTYDVVLLDARGHGRSDAPASGYAYAEQVADLAGAIAALGLQRPAMLGHSMGAGTALVLAGSFPDVPRAILLEDPGPWWMPIAETAELQTFSQNAAQRSRNRIGVSQEALITELRARYPSWSDIELEPLAAAKRRASPHALAVFDPLIWNGVDWARLLPRITCPVLLITTDQATGGVLGPDAAVALQTQVPQTQIAHIPQASHGIRRDQFARYMAVITPFLAATAR